MRLVRLMVWVLLLAGAIGGPADAQTPVCATAPVECTGWVAVGTATQRLRVYRSHPLDQANPAIQRALVVVHGGGRNADSIFRSGLAAAFLAGGADTTLVVSPRFASTQGSECRDSIADGEIAWGCAGWRWGGPAPANDSVTTFDAMDATLRQLARKELFPNLRAIVVAGFSAGGQYVVRYAMANKVHDALGVPVSYVVGSPSSYAYPDASRPDAGDGTFQPFIDAQNCTTYHRWPYGLQNRAGYAAALTDDQLRAQLVGPSDHVSARRPGHDARVRLRRHLPGHGAGPVAPGPCPVVPEADDEQVRSEARARRRPRLRPQRPLRLHIRRGLAVTCAKAISS